MKISNKTDYALRALVDLACQEPGTLLSIRKLAVRNDIPKRFLEQIMIDLKDQGWVKALPGRDGGHQLAITPQSLTLGQVVRHFDGVLAPIACVSLTDYKPCSQEATCRFRRAMLNVRNYTATLLDQQTLADVVAHGAPVNKADLDSTAFENGGGI